MAGLLQRSVLTRPPSGDGAGAARQGTPATVPIPVAMPMATKLPTVLFEKGNEDPTTTTTTTTTMGREATGVARKKPRIESNNSELVQPEMASAVERMATMAAAQPAAKRLRTETSDSDSDAPQTLVAKLLDTVHQFRTAEREFWQRQQELERSSKRMGELCTEIEMLAAKLKGETAHTPSSSKSPGNAALWAMADDHGDSNGQSLSDQQSSSNLLQSHSPSQDPRRDLVTPTAVHPTSADAVRIRWPARLIAPMRQPTHALGNISLASAINRASAAQVLATRFDVKAKSFRRKPRSVLVHPSPNGPLSNLIATSALDGLVQFWSARDREVKSQFCPCPEAKWVEDICWVGGGSAMAMAYNWGLDSKDNINRCKSQLGLVTFTTECKINDFRIKDIQLTARPHSAAAISALCHFPDDGAHSLSLISGGRDHKIFLWRLRPSARDDLGIPWETSLEQLSVPHSATIQTLCCTDDHVLYSGGVDRKVFGTDLVKRATVHSPRYTDGVNSLLLNPRDRQMLLVTLASFTNQFTLTDLRTHQNIKRFGWSEQKNISAYIKPSWSPSGNMIACPGAERGVVQLWDIRYIDPQQPAQVIELSEGTVNHTVFHPREPTLLVTAERSFVFTSYEEGRM